MSEVVLSPPPPVTRQRHYGAGFWGMAMVICTEATTFIGLLSTYFFLRASSAQWPQGGIPIPKLGWISVFSVILVSSSIPVVVAEHAIKRGHLRRMQVGLVLAFLMGAAFLGHEAYEWSHLEFAWGDNAYSSIFYATTGLHGLHVLVGLGMNVQVLAKSALGRITPERHTSSQIFGMYWHFVDVVWIFVFSSLYLSEHIR